MLFGEPAGQVDRSALRDQRPHRFVFQCASRQKQSLFPVAMHDVISALTPQLLQSSCCAGANERQPDHAHPSTFGELEQVRLRKRLLVGIESCRHCMATLGQSSRQPQHLHRPAAPQRFVRSKLKDFERPVAHANRKTAKGQRCKDKKANSHENTRMTRKRHESETGQARLSSGFRDHLCVFVANLRLFGKFGLPPLRTVGPYLAGLVPAPLRVLPFPFLWRIRAPAA